MKTKRAKAKPARRLSDAMMEKLPRAEKGTRYGVSDSQVPGLRVRVTATGSKTFLVWRRLEGRQFWTTRYLGKFPGMVVDAARTKAREFLAQIEAGDEYFVADMDHRRAALGHGSGRVDARHVRKVARHAGVSGGAQSVLIIERGIGDSHEHFAGRQVEKGLLRDLGVGFAGGVFGNEIAVEAGRNHVRPPRRTR